MLEPAWPQHLGDQVLVGNFNSDVAILCGWAEINVFRKKMQNVFEEVGGEGDILSRVAAIGNLYSPARGVDALLRNVRDHPYLRTIILTGPDLSEAMSELQAAREVTNSLAKHKKEEAWRFPDLRIRIQDDFPKCDIEELMFDLNLVWCPSLVEAAGYLRKHLESSGDLQEIRNRVFYPPPAPKTEKLPSPENVHTIRSETIGPAWLEILYQIMTFGTEVDTHYGEPSKEMMNLCTVISNQPPSLHDRKDLPDYIPFDLDHLQTYCNRLISGDEDPTVSYTYGNLMRKHFGVDQIRRVAEKLVKDPSSRSAVIGLWDPNYQGRHSPCLNHIWFRLMKSRLHMTALIRSNDMFFGWPENAFGLRNLQDMVRALICAQRGDYQDSSRCGLGDLTIISQSAHIYERDWRTSMHIIGEYRKPKEHHDEKGQWLVRPGDEPGHVRAELVEPDGPVVAKVQGNADEVLKTIDRRRLVSDIGHALWLGSEIRRQSDHT